MKKAVIATGGKQYIVAEGDEVNIELVKIDKKTLSFEPLLIIDGEKVSIGKPKVKDSLVNVQITSLDEKQDKVTSIRYKAKKRVRKVHGHRQRLATIKIVSIK